ncbi:MAG TPA: nicotinate (nicotinamide) nucleotide adenylyltransferase, partial [Trichococcus flocculiformis]|nr:nicotinate (nicotinamide) nucleotide adenylyltransferase [Trichococcus flocculiformis]
AGGTSAAHRLAMCECFRPLFPELVLDTTEIARGGKSYTIDTMKLLTAMHPDTDYYFIIGGDMVEYLPKWKDIDALVQLVQFVGVSRPGYGRESVYPIIWVDAPLIDISSTEIRKMVKTGRSIRYLVKEDVKDYILEEGLYLEDED